MKYFTRTLSRLTIDILLTDTFTDLVILYLFTSSNIKYVCFAHAVPDKHYSLWNVFYLYVYVF